MSKHTPGPWEWWTSNSWKRLRHSNRGVSTDVLMPVVLRDGQPTIDVSEDDMALIVSAPELLDGCRIALILLRNRDQNEREAQAVNLLKAVIARAEGR